MTAQLILGRPLQHKLIASALDKSHSAGLRPCVVLISVANSDSMLAINRDLHLRTFTASGIEGVDVSLEAETTLETLLEHIRAANVNPSVHGIMVLMPLPPHISIREVLPAISAHKELEGLHPDHLAGLLSSNRTPDSSVLPVVGEAVIRSLADHDILLEDRNIVLLTEETLMRDNPVANVIARCVAPAMVPLSSPFAVVPIDHHRAQSIASAADVLIVSLERPEMVSAAWIKPGATVIDFNPSLVGFTNREDGRRAPVLRGGVAIDSVSSVAGHIMPVPGGIGPVMLGMLVRNLTRAALSTVGEEEGS